MRRVLPAALAVIAFWAIAIHAQQPTPAPAPAAQDAAGRGRGGRATPPGLEPRIVSFEARPATVVAGEPVLLVWATENPAGGVTIDQNIGAVVARGSKTVTLRTTTTFTLTMRGGPSRTVTVTVQGAVPAKPGVAAERPAGSGTIPRTP